MQVVLSVFFFERRKAWLNFVVYYWISYIEQNKCIICMIFILKLKFEYYQEDKVISQCRRSNLMCNKINVWHRL